MHFYHNTLLFLHNPHQWSQDHNNRYQHLHKPHVLSISLDQNLPTQSTHKYLLYKRSDKTHLPSHHCIHRYQCLYRRHDPDRQMGVAGSISKACVFSLSVCSCVASGAVTVVSTCAGAIAITHRWVCCSNSIAIHFCWRRLSILIIWVTSCEY